MTTPLAILLREKIAANGPLPLADYMAQCLYHPQHGYYTTGRNFRTQPPADFTTAPELTPLFGYAIATWVQKAWHTLGSPTTFTLAECGPGRGTLMHDVLTHLAAAAPQCLAAAQPILIETSPALTALQKQTLHPFPQCAWAEELPQTATPLILIANEFLDAFPVQQQVNGQPQSVTLDAEQNFTLTQTGPVTQESSPTQTAWLQQLAAYPGPAAALLADYGAAPESPVTQTDTLQAVHAHKHVSIFHAPGESDLTAHVNFTHVHHVLGPQNCTLATLADFLLAHDIVALGLQHPTQQSALQRLLHPAQMGTLFKVSCYTRTRP